MTDSVDKADFLLVTALEEERDAVVRKLPKPRRVSGLSDDVHTYFVSDLPTQAADGTRARYCVAVLLLLGMGRVETAVATASALNTWRPDYVVLVGIAGGVADAWVRVGDLIISDQIIDYELQKLSGSADPEMRPQVHRADARLLSAAMNHGGSRWQKTISRRPKAGAPKRRIGPIATGDKVIAKTEFIRQLRKNWPKFLGIEMEAGGVAAACFRHPTNPGFFMVRGVSDLADEEKNSAGVEEWRSYAAELAASYAIDVLKNGPVPFSAKAFERSPEVRETLPKAQMGRFTLAIARLEHDDDRNVERLIADALRELSSVQILRFDRMISLEGGIPEESEAKGHKRAHEFLDESGADVLIWGTVLHQAHRAAPRLFWSTHLAMKRSTELYVPRDFKLPEIFWEDLSEVLRVAVATAAIISLPYPGRYVTSGLAVFATRLQTLIRSRDNKNWSDFDYAMMSVFLGRALVLLGSQNGNYKLVDQSITMYREALRYVSKELNVLAWAETSNELASAYRISGERMADMRQLDEALTIIRGVAIEVAVETVPWLKCAVFKISRSYCLDSVNERSVLVLFRNRFALWALPIA